MDTLVFGMGLFIGAILTVSSGLIGDINRDMELTEAKEDLKWLLQNFDCRIQSEEAIEGSQRLEEKYKELLK